MISWIQNTFQHHFRKIFAVLLVLLIVSFVFTIGAAPGIGNAESKVLRREFFGVNLGSQEEVNRIMGDAELSVYLQAGYPAIGADQLQQYALQRHAGLHLANQLNVPAPTTAEVTEYIQTLGAFTGQTGQFDAQRYADFRNSLKTSPNLKEGDISRVLGDDLRYNRVQRLLAGPGYVLPSEVREQLTRADATWSIAVATADYAAFSPDIKPSDAELLKFFEDNAFRYEFPPRVRLSYAEFPLSAYASQVTVSDAEIRAYYDANPTRFPKPAEGIAAPAIGTGADADFAAVRGQVESALRAERALNVAAKAASDLSLALFEAKVPQSGVNAFLASRGVQLKTLAPFDESTVPPELGANPQVATEALKLNADRHFSDAIPTPAGAAVLFWQETVPARKPLYSEVAARVGVDFVENEKRKRFVDVGRSVRDQLRARVKAGESFESAAAAVSNLKLTVKTHAGFTRRQPPADADYAALNALDSVNQGEVSEMIGSADKGLFIYAAEKKLPDLSEANPQYATTRTQLAQAYSARAGNEYLFELVQKELAKTAPATP
ncbi:MAG TPA: peptidyl-prolyl cis-trans isomerase [Opitutaceae bacterium]